MTRQIIIGITAEGSTDIRFLESVIQRTFEDVAFECLGQLEILPIQRISKQSGDFVESIKKCSSDAGKIGVMILCVHADADNSKDENTFINKIMPAFQCVNNIEDIDCCKNLVAIVPIHMTEAWMLSDKELLKTEIGTTKSDEELNIYRNPEEYDNPKDTIENAIRIGRQELPKRRRHELTISDLYSLIGQKIALTKLESLLSYQKFKNAIRDTFKKLNFMH
jgi:hypothetical protein